MPDPAPRQPIVRVVESESKRTKHPSLKSIVGNMKRMVLGQWKFEEQESFVKLHLFDNEHVLPKFEVVVFSTFLVGKIYKRLRAWVEHHYHC